MLCEGPLRVKAVVRPRSAQRPLYANSGHQPTPALRQSGHLAWRLDPAKSTMLEYTPGSAVSGVNSNGARLLALLLSLPHRRICLFEISREAGRSEKGMGVTIAHELQLDPSELRDILR
jgi:hypothetical protein